MHHFESEPENLEGFRSITDPQKFLSLAWQNEIHTQGLGSLVDFEILTRPFDFAGAYLISSSCSVSGLAEHLRPHLGKYLFEAHLERMLELYVKSKGGNFEIFKELSQYDSRFSTIGEVGANCRIEARLEESPISNDKAKWLLIVARGQAERAFDPATEINPQDRIWNIFDVLCEVYCIKTDLNFEETRNISKKLIEYVVDGVINSPSDVLNLFDKQRLLGACYAFLLLDVELAEQPLHLKVAQYVQRNVNKHEYENTLDSATSFLEGVSDFFDSVGKKRQSISLSDIIHKIDQLLFKDHKKKNEPILLDDKPVGKNLLEDALMNFQFASWGLEQKKAWCLSLTHRLLGNRGEELSALEQSVLASEKLAEIGLGVGSPVIYERSVINMLPEKDTDIGFKFDITNIPELIKVSIPENEQLIQALSSTANLMARMGQPSVPYEVLTQVPHESLSKVFQAFAHGVCERFNPKLAIRRWLSPEVKN